MEDTLHIPVMEGEVCSFLKCRSGGTYIDGTVGIGGHAEAILCASSPSGRLFGIDRDAEAVILARKRLSHFENRVQILQKTFSKVEELTAEKLVSCADGILLDLGVSSYQIENWARGFSFSHDGPLDMRMDKSQGVSAAELIEKLSEETLSKIIFDFGEERHARKIAREIVFCRNKRPIKTTVELAKIISSALSNRRRGKIHPATKTFQAIRIYVNDEMAELKKFLDSAPRILCREGRLVIISFHSLEDRMVKRAFKEWEGKGTYKVVTKHVVTASEDERLKNPRSRSAKLRVLEKIGL